MYLFLFTVGTGGKSALSVLLPSPRPPPPQAEPSHFCSHLLWLVTSAEAPLVVTFVSVFSVPTPCPLCGTCPFPRPSLLSLGCPAFLRAPPSPSLWVPMQAWKESYSCGSGPYCLCLIKASLVFKPLPPCFSPPVHPSHHCFLPRWQPEPTGWAVSTQERGIPGCSAQSGKSVGCGIGQTWIPVLALPLGSC